MNFWMLLKKLIVIGMIAFVFMLIIYVLFIRPWIFTMGSTKAELKASMAGDRMVANGNSRYTQAITINAPSNIVWEYMIQMGCFRAGWYNLDFINRMSVHNYFYENNKSANRVIPELQALKVGDKIYIVPALSFKVSELQKNDHMLLTVQNDKGKYMTTWSYQLKEIDKNTTRLIVRWNSILEGGIFMKLINYFIIDLGGSGIQQRLSLKGIKSRAENTFIKSEK